ncbi:MAG TPA: SDR family oxidoreductase [Caulifigura sp.]|jgi:NAD(P)-dependent dehydrogenase (short-subunit alcohol dehydrogenase family)|nr:SDR family oxidoreductase [Caulifigura sp.]
MRLAGKTALVTGGGTGIGAGCALALAKEGCRVVVSGRREDKLKEAAGHFTGQPPMLTCVADVGDRNSATALVEWAQKELGRIDILINCAGINTPKRQVSDLDPADWDMVMSVNATGAFNVARAALPAMRERKDGLIVNISSTSGHRASMLGGAAYSASKFAMAALGTCIALEEKDRGIRVTNLYPGEVETPILDKRPVPVSAEHRAKILQPSDVGDMVVAIALLPPRAHVPEIIIKPTTQAHA